ncbi:MAG: SGNH/GDSL hydrolase family protein [bacterium]|nr:MAG: SGNH/GDSL hydrolase family protein [bacterium]
MTRQNAFRNTAIVIIGLMMALALFEIILRLAYGDMYRKRPEFFLADDELGWKPSANLDHTFYGPDFKIDIRTDNEGNRLGTLGETDLSKGLVILCGDSYIFGWGVSTNETCCSYLDELLSDASNRNLRVLNLGATGFGTLQYYYRLKQFLKRHREVRIAAIIVAHAHNDAVDNIKSVGYHLDLWNTRNRNNKAKSPFHIVNFISYSVDGIRSERAPRADRYEASVEREPHLRDVLLVHELNMHEKKFPSTVEFDGHIVSFMDISEEDYSIGRTIERESLTTLQRDLILVGIDFIHYMTSHRNMKIFHLTVPTTPGWYIGEMNEILNQSNPSQGNEVVNLGQFPGMTDFTEDAINDHSGGHYTPAFNRYWAYKLLEILLEHGIVRRQSY